MHIARQWRKENNWAFAQLGPQVVTDLLLSLLRDYPRRPCFRAIFSNITTSPVAST
jgi:hypothetical protein